MRKKVIDRANNKSKIGIDRARKEHLTTTEQDTFKDIRKAIGYRKFVTLMLKVYNTLCNNCRLKVSRNPKLDIKEYCINCQTNIKERLKGVVK